MNGSGDVVRAGSNTCRSYGAWPGVVGTTTINMALLAELGRPPDRPAEKSKNPLAFKPCIRMMDASQKSITQNCFSEPSEKEVT